MQGGPKQGTGATRVRQPVLTAEEQRLQREVRKQLYAAVLGEEAQRQTIAFVFVHVFDAPDEDEWDSERPARQAIKTGLTRGAMTRSTRPAAQCRATGLFRMSTSAMVRA